MSKVHCRASWLWVLVALVLSNCSSEEPFAELPCDDGIGLTVHCGFTNPEDIAVLPGEHLLLISEMGEFQNNKSYGKLSVFDIAKDKRVAIEPVMHSEPIWGDPECSTPTEQDIHPHGTDLSQNEKGEWVYAVINHHPREAIELFQVIIDADDTNNAGNAGVNTGVATDASQVNLVWRGCLLPPEGAYLNSVVRIPDGRYYATHMFDIDSTSTVLIGRLILGITTGDLLEWAPGTGFRSMGNPGIVMPNGIAANEDGSTLYVNNYFGKRVHEFNTSNKSYGKSFQLQSEPDNIKFINDKLWVAGHDYELSDTELCVGRVSTCPLDFTIYTIDPATEAVDTLLQYGRNDYFGTATVAVPAAGRLWMGSYLGDRMASVPLK